MTSPLPILKNSTRWRCATSLTSPRFHPMPPARCRDFYRLLDAGAAVGKNCGPLLVSREEGSPAALPDARIGIPGRHTHRASALQPLCRTTGAKRSLCPSTGSCPRCQQGRIDLGVIIHEGRFTYKSYGLKEVADLGVWWEELTGLPLPLGGIIARRSLPPDTISDFTAATA